jgi:hypothetical protein
MEWLQTDFEGTKERLQPRPWLIDDATAFAYKWNNHTYKKAIIFVVRAPVAAYKFISNLVYILGLLRV